MCSSDLNAALGVDPADAVVVALLGQLAFLFQGTAQRHRRAQAHGVTGLALSALRGTAGKHQRERRTDSQDSSSRHPVSIRPDYDVAGTLLGCTKPASAPAAAVTALGNVLYEFAGAAASTTTT